MFVKVLLLVALAALTSGSVVHQIAPAPVVTQTVVAEEYDSHPQYSFGYGVNDPLTGDAKSQVESRNGDAVQGQYTVDDPDGTKRIVDYSADDLNGFNAIVRKVPNNKAVVAAAAPIVAPARVVASVPVVAPTRVVAAAPVVAPVVSSTQVVASAPVVTAPAQVVKTAVSLSPQYSYGGYYGHASYAHPYGYSHGYPHEYSYGYPYGYSYAHPYSYAYKSQPYSYGYPYGYGYNYGYPYGNALW